MIYLMVLIALFGLCYLRGNFFYLLGFLITATYLSLGSANGFDWINYYRFYVSPECCSDLMLGYYEPGFLLLLSFFKAIGLDFWQLRFLLGLFFAATLFFVNRNSKERNLAVFIVFALVGYFAFIDQLRQGVSISIIMMSAAALRSGRYGLFVLGAFVASSIHASAMVAFVLGPLWVSQGSGSSLKRLFVGLSMLSVAAIFPLLLEFLFVFGGDLPLIGHKFTAYAELSEVFAYMFPLSPGRLPVLALICYTLYISRRNIRFLTNLALSIVMTLTNIGARFGYFPVVFAVLDISEVMRGFRGRGRFYFCCLVFVCGLIPFGSDFHRIGLLSYRTVWFDVEAEIDFRCSQLSFVSDHQWVAETCL